MYILILFLSFNTFCKNLIATVTIPVLLVVAAYEETKFAPSESGSRTEFSSRFIISEYEYMHKVAYFSHIMPY